MKPQFYQGESVPVDYTILDDSGSALDLSLFSEIGADLYLVKRASKILMKEFRTNPTANQKALELSDPTTNGVVSIVVDPEYSKGLNRGLYEVRFYVKFSKAGDPKFPDAYDKKELNDVVEFELI